MQGTLGSAEGSIPDRPEINSSRAPSCSWHTRPRDPAAEKGGENDLRNGVTSSPVASGHVTLVKKYC